MLFKYFLDITSIMALILLINGNGNNNNSEKSIESHVAISDAVAIQLLESFATDKIKIFDKKRMLQLIVSKKIRNL